MTTQSRTYKRRRPQGLPAPYPFTPEGFSQLLEGVSPSSDSVAGTSDSAVGTSDSAVGTSDSVVGTSDSVVGVSRDPIHEAIDFMIASEPPARIERVIMYGREATMMKVWSARSEAKAGSAGFHQLLIGISLRMTYRPRK